MDDLQEILKECMKIRIDLGLDNLSDDMLFDKSVNIFISQNISKDKEQKKIDEKVSYAQVEYLKKLGYKGNLNITKREAMQLISEMKKERYNNGGEL